MLVLTPPFSVFTPEKFDWDSIWDNRRSGDADDEEDIAAIEKNKGTCGARKPLPRTNLALSLTPFPRLRAELPEKVVPHRPDLVAHYICVSRAVASSSMHAVPSKPLLCSVFLLVWPLSLYRDYVFTRSFFSGWTIVSIIWSFLAFTAVGIFPLMCVSRLFTTSDGADCCTSLSCSEGVPVFKSILVNLHAKGTGQPSPANKDLADTKGTSDSSLAEAGKAGSGSQSSNEHTTPPPEKD